MIIRKAILIIFLITIQSYSIEFVLNLEFQDRFCFYEVFEQHQKYNFKVQSLNYGAYEAEVSHIDGRQWKSIFFKSVGTGEKQVRVDKLAPLSTTYSFCLKNLQQIDHKYKLTFSSGIDVLQLHSLPDSTDGQNLQRQLNWLQKQIIQLSQKSDNIAGLRRINSQISNLVGNKIVFFAILGLLGIGGVNVLFYKLLKNQLKKRKII